MQRLLDWLLTRSESPKRAGKSAPSFRPRLEALEVREVLSTASAAPHAVMQDNNQTAVFYLNQADHAFYEADASGTHQLSGANTVQKFSAGLDTYGKADVFAQAGDNSFWKWTQGRGWQQLLGQDQAGDFAAVKGGRAYVQMTDGSLSDYLGNNFSNYPLFDQISGAGTVNTLDAVTDGSGNDAVFALMTDGTLQEHYGSYGGTNWNWIDNSTNAGFSVGTDMNGKADVFAVDSRDNSFWKWDNGWTRLADSGLVSQFSATDHGQVWFLESTGELDKFDGQNNLHQNVAGQGGFTSLSAAASNDVLMTNWDNTLWERLGGGSWKYIDQQVQSS